MRRRQLLAATLLSALPLSRLGSAASTPSTLPVEVPPGTKLVFAGQNEVPQALLAASGEQAKLAAEVTFANFLGGPAILEAFRAGALDIAMVGSTPPIQAHASGETLPIVAARLSTAPDYRLAVRPGLRLSTLEDLRGRSIAYAEGTGRQPFVLAALKAAGMTRDDVTFVPLRAADLPDAVRGGQVDVAPLNEPHFSRYLRTYADLGSSALPPEEHDRLPRRIDYLYTSGTSLADPAKAAAIRDVVVRWIAASRWAMANRSAWASEYYVKRQDFSPADAEASSQAEGTFAFPLLSGLLERQQSIIDLIVAAGDLPGPLDAREEFDLRFDDVIGPLAG
jgi:sulfonate transport system substrate-binding protein